MKIGYARVSTADQNLDLQLAALKEAGCGRIFQEKISGAKIDRPELQRLLDQLRPDDVVVVWKLDRLARSTQNLLELAEQIKSAEASFCSLSEPWADTSSPSGRMIMTVFAGIAEFERAIIREITVHGLAAAKARGRLGGRGNRSHQPLRFPPHRLDRHGRQDRCRPVRSPGRHGGRDGQR